MTDANAGVPPDALDERIDEERRLGDVLDPDETPRHLLCGTMLDVVEGSLDDERADRKRKMATDPGGLLTLVTDRRLVFVVAYRSSAWVRSVPLDSVESLDVQTAGEESRLRVERRGRPSFRFYPTDADAETLQTVVSSIRTDATSPPPTDDPLTALERLADLHERGAVTDEEFATKKAELLDRL